MMQFGWLEENGLSLMIRFSFIVSTQLSPAVSYRYNPERSGEGIIFTQLIKHVPARWRKIIFLTKNRSVRTFCLLLGLLIFSFSYSQHSHLKESGWKGKIKKITCVYYAEAQLVNNTWVPKDSLKYNYKTISYYNSQQYIDSVQTYLLLSGKEKLTLRKGYVYSKGSAPGGWYQDNLDDIRYSTTWEWIDKNCYSEVSKDETGKNSIHSKIFMDDKFKIVRKEMKLYREGELFDDSVIQLRYSKDNPDHIVSVTENKTANLEYSQDEYVMQRDKAGNPLKITLKDAASTNQSIKCYVIEYFE